MKGIVSWSSQWEIMAQVDTNSPTKQSPMDILFIPKPILPSVRLLSYSCKMTSLLPCYVTIHLFPRRVTSSCSTWLLPTPTKTGNCGYARTPPGKSSPSTLSYDLGHVMPLRAVEHDLSDAFFLFLSFFFQCKYLALFLRRRCFCFLHFCLQPIGTQFYVRRLKIVFM